MPNVISTTTIDVTINIVYNGLNRTWIAHIPAGALQGCAVMCLFHGGTGTGPKFKASMNMDPIADSEKFVTLYPTAINGNWTDGRISTSDGPDDIAFLKQMIWYMYQHYGTSDTKAFGTGISNGGIFLHWVMANAPNVFLGIAPVAGNIPNTYSAICTNSKPILMFNGTADTLDPFNGGVGGDGQGAGTDTMMSSYNSIAKYASNCKAKIFTDTDLPVIVADGTSITKRDWTGGSVAPVTLYVINNGGHTWPGGKNKGTTQPIVGKCTANLDASQVMVDAFKPFGLAAI
jgi:polyhydroxybutyrate depolymerase